MAKKLDKNKVIGVVLIVAAIIIAFFLTLSKNCKSNEECFNTAAAKCSKAKVITYSEDNKYNYEILGRKNDNCIINVKLLELSQAQPADMKQALEGRDMTCAISLENLKTKNLNQIEDLNDLCTGSLKEAYLQITIDKLYEIIVRNIGSVATEFSKGLFDTE